MAVAPAVAPVVTPTETQAIHQLLTAKGAAGAKAAAAAGLDGEAIREVLTAKAAAAKAGAAGAAGAKGAMAGTVPLGVEPDLFRQALAIKGGAVGTTVAMPGAEQMVLREAVVSKAVGGVAGAKASVTGAQAMTAGGSIWSGKGFSLGLGLGLGIWGPVLVIAAGAAAVYGYLEYRKRQPAEVSEEAQELDEGFFPEKA